GQAQLHASLRARPDVISLEGTDIRGVTPAMLAEPPDAVVVDVSFISLKLVLPATLALLRRPAWLVALIKPQFAAGRRQAKKGMVRDSQVQAAVCDDITRFAAGLGWNIAGVVPSPLAGRDGNREFLLGAVHD